MKSRLSLEEGSNTSNARSHLHTCHSEKRDMRVLIMQRATPHMHARQRRKHALLVEIGS